MMKMLIEFDREKVLQEQQYKFNRKGHLIWLH